MGRHKGAETRMAGVGVTFNLAQVIEINKLNGKHLELRRLPHSRVWRFNFTFICAVEEDLMELRDEAMVEFWAAGLSCQGTPKFVDYSQEQVPAAEEAGAMYILTIYRSTKDRSIKMKLREIATTRDRTFTSVSEVV